MSMLLLAHRDRPSWFDLPEENEAYLIEIEKKVNRNLSTKELNGVDECHLPHQVFEGPKPLRTDVEWYGFCPEHREPCPLEPRGYHGRPFPWQDLQSQWSSLQTRMHQSNNLSLSERTEATALALILATHHLNIAAKSPNDHSARPFISFLKQASHQWPESLNNQWPILEWILLEYACQTMQAEAKPFSNLDKNEIFLLLKENRPPINPEPSLYWRFLNAYKRYEWSLIYHRPMDALAYFRESHFLHSSLVDSFGKPVGNSPPRAMNAGGMMMDFWFSVAFLGVMSVIVWGRYYQRRNQKATIPVSLHDVPFPHQLEECENDEPITATKVRESSAPAYGDLACLWNSKLHTNQQWEDFKTKFNHCVPGFIPSLRLGYPRMTQSDIRLACLIRMGMTSVEISKIQNISNQGVSMARYRLRKRMGLGPEDSIPDILNEIGS